MFDGCEFFRLCHCLCLMADKFHAWMSVLTRKGCDGNLQDNHAYALSMANQNRVATLPWEVLKENIVKADPPNAR